MSAPEKDLDEQLAEAREEKRKHDEALDVKAKKDELEYLKLESHWEKETGGRHGSRFIIVNLCDIDEGFIVLKLGDASFQKKFETAIAKLKDGQKVSEMDLNQYVTPCVVHPPKEQFQALMATRYALWGRCATALATLFGIKKGNDESKF